MNLFRLDDKVAVVTGAASGLGLATSEMMAAQGARVAAWDIDSAALAALEKKSAGAVRGFRVDVSDMARLGSAVEETLAAFGRMDVLVNNAAICPRLPFPDCTEADWNRLMDINAKSQFFLMQKVCPIMKQQGGGRIVNISSPSGRVGSFAHASIYSGAKAAVMAMTKSIAREVASDGILVNCVAPGAMDTAQMHNLPGDQIRKFLDLVPLGRLARPEEVATCICFLASDACSYCTGATFDVNGGLLMY